MRALHALQIVAAASLLLGCPSAEVQPSEEQRRIGVRAVSLEEALDALTESFLARFEGMSETDRAQGVVVTTWQGADAPDRLERRRARGWVSGGAAERGDDSLKGFVVEVAVTLETSTAKTSFGDLDRESPHWVGGMADHALEQELLTEIKQRLATR